LAGDSVRGSYYEKQLMLAPTPGVDFKIEVITMTFIIYLDLDCLSDCGELVFVLKCVTVTLSMIVLGIALRLLKLINL